MAIEFKCACGKLMKAKEELAGRRARCTGCGREFVIPGGSTPPPPPVWHADKSPPPAKLTAMALKQCNEWGNDVGPQAASWPERVAMLQRSIPPSAYFWAAFLIFIAFVLIASLRMNPAQPMAPGKRAQAETAGERPKPAIAVEQPQPKVVQEEGNRLQPEVAAVHPQPDRGHKEGDRLQPKAVEPARPDVVAREGVAVKPAARNDPPPPDTITWVQFRADCGLEAQRGNEARTVQVFKKKYQDRTIKWVGHIYSIKEKPIGAGYLVLVRMDPSDSALGTYDLTLDAGEDLKEEILSLSKGDRVSFEGRITSQGGAITGHWIRLSNIGRG
jgi:hypothetical protein